MATHSSADALLSAPMADFDDLLAQVEDAVGDRARLEELGAQAEGLPDIQGRIETYLAGCDRADAAALGIEPPLELGEDDLVVRPV